MVRWPLPVSADMRNKVTLSGVTVRRQAAAGASGAGSGGLAGKGTAARKTRILLLRNRRTGFALDAVRDCDDHQPPGTARGVLDMADHGAAGDGLTQTQPAVEFQPPAREHTAVEPPPRQAGIRRDADGRGTERVRA